MLEASLARIWYHYNNSQFGILTSWRKENSLETNTNNFKKLKQRVKNFGLRFVQIKGKGQEEDPITGKVVPVEEPALVVINSKLSFNDFEQKIVELGNEYNQLGVITHSPETGTYLIELKNNVKTSLGKNISFNKMSDFYSQLSGNKTFVFEKVVGENYPENWIMGMGREAEGEIFGLCGKEDHQLSEIVKYLSPSTVKETNTGNPNVILIEEGNPLSAIDKWSKKPVVKFSYLPQTGAVLYSTPGDNHASAIHRAKDTVNFDKYVRVIYDPSKNTMGSRVWGLIDTEEDKIASYEEQYKAFEFFSKFDPNLKWIFNLTNNDLDFVEYLDSTKIKKNRVRTIESVKESKLNGWKMEIQNN